MSIVYHIKWCVRTYIYQDHFLCSRHVILYGAANEHVSAPPLRPPHFERAIAYPNVAPPCESYDTKSLRGTRPALWGNVRPACFCSLLFCRRIVCVSRPPRILASHGPPLRVNATRRTASLWEGVESGARSNTLLFFYYFSPILQFFDFAIIRLFYSLILRFLKLF